MDFNWETSIKVCQKILRFESRNPDMKSDRI